MDKEVKKLYERNFRKWGLDLNLTVTLVSLFALVSFVGYSMTDISGVSISILGMQTRALKYFDKLFLIVPVLIVHHHYLYISVSV